MKADPTQPLLAAIEAGGTKFVCAIGTGPDDIRARAAFPTQSPEQTLADVRRWFVGQRAILGPFEALGVGSFGPVDLDRSSQTFGYITTTPKPGWQHTDLVGALQSQLKVPVGFDTDVNAAALGEWLWGAGLGMDPLVYITVGTGIGGGALVNGRLLHGALHPEMGHILVPPPGVHGAVNPKGQCPYHDHCMEGYVSGMAIMKRWGVVAENLPERHPVWEEVSEVLAQGLANIIVTLSPRRIVLGGGVMRQAQLFHLTRAKVARVLNEYLRIPELGRGIEEFIVPAGLGENAGIVGALALASQELMTGRPRRRRERVS